MLTISNEVRLKSNKTCYTGIYFVNFANPTAVSTHSACVNKYMKFFKMIKVP